MNQERIGKFIKELRNDKKLTQQDLADKLGVTNRAVSKWENGLSLPDYSILNDLCEVLDISINELLSGEKLDKKDYQKKFEENVFKSISYKINKNNKINFLKLIIIMIILIIVIIFGVRVYTFFSLDTRFNISDRNAMVNNVKLIYQDIESNVLANHLVIEDDVSIYIPNDYKEYTDLKSSHLVETGCSVFIKNYKDDSEEDGYIKICEVPTDFKEEYKRDAIYYLNRNNKKDYYDWVNTYYNMKNVNIFSNVDEIKTFNFLSETIGDATFGISKIYMLKRDLIKACLFENSDVFTGEREDGVTYISAGIIEKGTSVNKYSLHNEDNLYSLEIVDYTNELKIEDAIKMIESIKVRGEAGFAKFLRE